VDRPPHRPAHAGFRRPPFAVTLLALAAWWSPGVATSDGAGASASADTGSFAPARAGAEAPATGPGSLAAAVAAAGDAPAAPDVLAAVGPAHPPAGFTVRRVVNPRYRPPVAGIPALPPGATSTLRALDWARLQIAGRGSGAATRSFDWLASIGSESRRDRAFGLEATGARQGGASRLRTLRFDGRRGPLSGALGDVPPITVGRVASIQRLRGARAAIELGDGSRWSALGGGPTPVPGIRTRPYGVGGVSLEGLPFEEGLVSVAAFGYGLGDAPRNRYGVIDPDSLPGHGGLGSVGLRAPLGPGALTSTVIAGWHRRGDDAGLAAQTALEWNLASPTLVVSVRDERGTPRARVLTGDRATAAPTGEDRWNAQARFLRGRAETHFTGVVRDGGDPGLETRTVNLGASGAFGASAWYAGTDLTWDRRALLAATERRASLYAGRAGVGGALLMRAERATNDLGRDALLVSGEASAALPRGGRLALEPRLGWDAERLARGSLGARLTWPLSAFGARIAAGLTWGVEREQDYRGALREAELSLSLLPRARDRGEVEVRRLDDGGSSALEYTASYDLQAPRYERAGGWLISRRDSSRIAVQVVRSGNRSGVPDVLISLDHRELRFTDAEGWAHFDHVGEGVHVLAIEERSLPAPYVPVSTTRVFVTLERGRIVEPVTFEIGRPERRQRF
jgi:hypothetical protein